MWKIYEDLRKHIPTLNFAVNNNVGVVYIGDILVFETKGQESESVIEAYLYGMTHGIVFGNLNND